jgi:hypothetical protein
MGSSTIGKGDTSRPGVRGDKKGGQGVFTEKTYSNIGAKTRNLAGYTSIAPNPQVNPNKMAVEKPSAKLPAATGVETVAGVKTKNIPRSYVPSRIKQIFDPTPFATPVVKMPAAKTKKPVAKPAAQVISNVTNEKLSPAKKATPRAKPPATRFGTVTGKTTGTMMRGGGGYGGGGTRGSGSLSGGGSGTRSAGTSRTGGTQRNDPVRG